ncbi:hypothetical protein AVEN_95628-1 [Araneus ventricosus]|uniref:Uncharacterized protein n=1 Tax=Araneus ventricosus TaxID=182803 RepID=A0A4Y2JRT4_ARAVE|nr:hypothetical protein AVEN_95628-1 [Araneus ventricosus]
MQHYHSPLAACEALAETQRKAELEEKQRQEALAELRRKDEVELERLKIEAQLKLGITTTEAEYSKLPSKEISKFLHRFEVKEDISLYLVLFERQVHQLSIPKELWVSYLLGLLPPEISHIIAREPDEKVDDYDHVKELLLKRFKLTPEKFRQLFPTHQKTYNRTWTDYYHELVIYFDGWILGLKIETYEDLRTWLGYINVSFLKQHEGYLGTDLVILNRGENLRKLIISAQMKQQAPTDFKEHFRDEWTSISSPDELAENLKNMEMLRKR